MGFTKFLINFIIYETLYTLGDSANILAVFPNVWKSQYIFGRTIISELAASQGHNITLMGAYSDKPQENLTEIEIDGIEQNWIEMGLSFTYDEIRSKSILERFTKMIDVGTSNADLILGSREMQNLMESGQKFDLLIVDLFLSDALLGLAYYFKVPTIVVSATGTNKWLNEMTGNPHNSAIDPNSFLPFLEEMTLSERLVNTLMTIFEKLTYNFFHVLCQESVYKRHFTNLIQDEELPPLRNLVHNVNLILVNSHPFIHYPRAYISNMIEIGGAHLTKKNYGLSKEILQFIEGAPNGVIYISFGANLRTIDLPKDKLDVLTEVINSLKDSMRIILKWEVPRMENQPPNTLLAPWWPQQEILAHANVKIFITTGGLLSTMEGIRWKTPLLGIPILPEQEVNIMRTERLGCGIKLSYDNFTADSLLWGIKDILSYQSYQDNIEKASEIFTEGLNDPLDKAIYYVNLVLKTGGANYLRSNSTKFGFLRTELIDVLLIIFAGIFAILAVPSIVICVILKKTNNCKPPEWILCRNGEKIKQS